MKKLLFATTMLALTGCAQPKVKASPRPTPVQSLKRTSLVRPLEERRHSEVRTFDVFRSEKETMVLHAGGVEFLGSGKQGAGETDSAGILSEEAVFTRKALAGSFSKDGKAIVLFEDGDVSLIDFKTNSPPTFKLFSPPIKARPKAYLQGNTCWFVLFGSPKIAKVVWKGEADVTVTRFVCDKIKEIKENMNIRCDKNRCRIYSRSRLLEEIK